jgi:cytochrome c oxidase subunit 2
VCYYFHNQANFFYFEEERTMLSARNAFVSLSIGLVAMLFVMAACGAPSSGGGASASGGTSEIKVTASDFKFEPADWTVKAGSKVKVTMANKGALEHTWVLKDANGNDVAKLESKVGQTKSVDFTAPATGSYAVICDVAGHKEQGMVGKLTVQ